MMSLAARARADAEAARREVAEYQPPIEQIHRLTAYRVGEILGVDVDPRDVVDVGWERPYYWSEVTVAGITFVGRFMSDSNGLHHISAPMLARRRGKGLLRWHTKERKVERIGDLDGWL